MTEQAKYIEWKDMPTYQFSPEKKLGLIRRSYLRLLGDLCVGLTQRWGEEAWQILHDVAWRLGQEQGPRFKERFNIDPDNLLSIAQYFRFEYEILQGNPEDVKVLDVGPKRLHEHLHNCALLPACERLPELCWRFFKIFDVSALKAMGAKVQRFDVLQWPSLGAPYEEPIYELEGYDGNRESEKPGIEHGYVPWIDMPVFNISTETKIRLNQQSYLSLITDVIIAFTQQYGEEAWAIITELGRRIGQERAPKLKERFKIDISDIRSIYQIFRFDEDLFSHTTLDDIKLVELTPKRLVEHLYKCAHEQQCKRCPDMCSRLWRHIEVGTLEALGVKIKEFTFGRKLSSGDSYEETIFEID